MGARLYVPAIGRFLQTDPVQGGSANDYDYCNADPINCTDLDGQRPDNGRFGSPPLFIDGRLVYGRGPRAVQRTVRGTNREFVARLAFQPGTTLINKLNVRGLSMRDVANTLRNGRIFYDRTERNYAFVARRPGRGYMYAAWDPLTGAVATAYRSSKRWSPWRKGFLRYTEDPSQ